MVSLDLLKGFHKWHYCLVTAWLMDLDLGDFEDFFSISVWPSVSHKRDKHHWVKVSQRPIIKALTYLDWTSTKYLYQAELRLWSQTEFQLTELRTVYCSRGLISFVIIYSCDHHYWVENRDIFFWLLERRGRGKIRIFRDKFLWIILSKISNFQFVHQHLGFCYFWLFH